ncbi:metal-dependent hydrolase [Aporhodopirellula aestuarii]|uniref:Metal-dependent hydrolase n=1 Tax=Aporhodopirellula aestuarii TaxID=2950107 RepID=A0ABT0U4E5_9BACT|nr:metal-dependent hydrolase [Aporhodopirellula aestuarii]MCM2371216.1 metal-dependent hydrolase [Aporhodopirellula aestuarii]
MAGFKTHISTSTVVGVAYGYWGVTSQGMSLESGLLAGGLCSVAGMLPDLDSDSGVPLRETSLFMAAIAPMLMIDRFRDMGLSNESMALAAMLVYIGIRFVAVEFFRRYTVHRGMWHSIPAALVAGLGAYLIMPCPSEAIRVYKSLAVLLGFLTHLILDEIWSLDFSSGRFRVKKSFGTALKFFGNDWWANVSVWGKLVLLCYLAWGDHAILDRLRQRVRLERERYAIPEPTWGPESPASLYPQQSEPNSLPPYPAPSQPTPGYSPGNYWQALPADPQRVAVPPPHSALPWSGDAQSF